MKTTTRLMSLSVLLLGSLVMGSAFAKSDAAFMKDAAKAGASEVEASKLAQTKAKRPEVKAFADTMVTEHTALADQLRTLAVAKKVELPDHGSLIDKSKLKLIQAGDDDKFDQRYVKSFGVKAHEEVLKLFEEAARDSKDADVKAFVEKALPNLRHHLEMARGLDTK